MIDNPQGTFRAPPSHTPPIAFRHKRLCHHFEHYPFSMWVAPVFLISHPNHLATLSPNLVLIFFLPCWICQDSGLDHFSLHTISLNDGLSPMTCKPNDCQGHPKVTDVLTSGWHIQVCSQPLHLSTRHLTLNISKQNSFFLGAKQKIIQEKPKKLTEKQHLIIPKG